MDSFTINPELCRITLTDKQRSDLRTEMERTGLSTVALFQRINNPPDQFTATTIERWLNRDASARLDHWIAVQNVLGSIETIPGYCAADHAKKAQADRIKLSSDKIGTIKNLIDETRMPLKTFFDNHSAALPNPLTYSIAKSWLNGSIKSARRNHYEQLKCAYEALPKFPAKIVSPAATRIQNGIEEIELEHSILQQLNTLQRESGLRPRQLLERLTDVPDRLDHLIILNWMARKIQWADKSHVDYVLKAWADVNSSAPFMNG